MNDTYYEGIKANIASHGRHLQGVFPCVGDPGLPFIYSIGNTDKGLPELLVIGCAEVPMAHFMNNLCDQMVKRGRAFDNGEVVYWEPREPHMKGVKVINASAQAKGDYTVQAGQHYGHENYAVMQVIVPDTNGKYPGEEGCEFPFADVPVLGVQ